MTAASAAGDCFTAYLTAFPFSSSLSLSTAFGVLKLGFDSVPGSSAGMSIYRLGLAVERFCEPLEEILPREPNDSDLIFFY